MGGDDLGSLLRGLTPELDSRLFVFASVPEISSDILADDPICLFREAEGWTVIVEEGKADKYGAADSLRFAMITLAVYSDLETVGLTAAAATALAAYGIPANVVAAYHHDHIFTPAECAEDAIDALDELSGLIDDL
ncbi:MAG: ACT domain-containing protein [Neomegalonema sp.]|nr:ACT domain-containing protein [Neomegalonema sp.]